MIPADARSTAPPALPNRFDEAKTTFIQCCYNYNQYLMYLLHKNGLLKGSTISIKDMNEIKRQAGFNPHFSSVSSHRQKDAYLPTATVPWKSFKRDLNVAYIEALGAVIASDVRVFSSPMLARSVVNRGYDNLIRNEADLELGLGATLFEPAANIVMYMGDLGSPPCPPSFYGAKMNVAKSTAPSSRKSVDLSLSLVRDGVGSEMIVIELTSAGREEAGIRLAKEKTLQARFEKDLADKDFLGRIHENAKNRLSQSQKPTLGLTGEILSRVYTQMLDSGISYGMLTDGYFLLFLTFAATDGRIDYAKIKYHFSNYDDYRNVTAQRLIHKPETPLSLLLCLVVMASRNEILARREGVKAFKTRAIKVGDHVEDTKEHDQQNPSHQKKRARLLHAALGSQTTPDITDREQAPFCTPQCLEGLFQRGLLDPECPNFEWHRHLDKSILRHKLTVEQVKEGLTAQMDLDDQTLFAHLGYMNRGGLIGIPFRITLMSHGYTMVGKGVSNKHYHDLVDESAIYDYLPTAQGNLIPVSLGILSMKRAKVTFFRGRVIQHFLLLSWGGDRFTGRESSEVQDMVQDARKQLRAYGLSHNDLHYGNVLWHPQLQKPYIMDLERATFYSDGDSISEIE